MSVSLHRAFEGFMFMFQSHKTACMDDKFMPYESHQGTVVSFRISAEYNDRQQVQEMLALFILFGFSVLVGSLSYTYYKALHYASFSKLH